MKAMLRGVSIGVALMAGVIPLAAQNSIVNYQGHVQSGGSALTGVGQSKFALVTTGNQNLTATAAVISDRRFSPLAVRTPLTGTPHAIHVGTVSTILDNVIP
jgi:hypothetical protein